MSNYRTTIKKVLKGALWASLILLLVFSLLVGAILLPPVQHFITGKVVHFLEQKLDTRVSLEKLYIGFPKSVVVEKLYVEDQNQDTLVYLNKLKVDVDLIAIIDNHVNIRSAEIDGLTAHISRTHPDSTFNFDFIPQAFSSEEPKPAAPADTSSSDGMQISVGDVALTNIYGSFRDEVSGMNLWGKLGELSVSVYRFDLDNMVFEVDDLELHETAVVMETVEPPLPPVDDTDTSATDFQLALNSTLVERVRFEMRQPEQNSKMTVDVGQFELTALNLALADEYVEADRLSLATSNFTMIQDSRLLEPDSTSGQSTPQPIDPLAIIPWHFQVKSLQIENQTVRMQDRAVAQTPGEFNAAQLQLDSLQLRAENISYNTEKAQLALLSVSGKERNSNVILSDLRGDLALDHRSVSLQSFHLTTPKSKLELAAETHYDQFSDLLAEVPRGRFNLKISDSQLAVQDAYPFSPELRETLVQNGIPNPVIGIDTDISGNLEQMEIKHLFISVNKDTQLSLSGTLADISDPITASANITLQELSTTRQGAMQFIPAESIPETIRLPHTVSLSGTIDGGMSEIATDLMLRTSSGDIALQATGANLSGSSPSYTAQLATEQLDLGSIVLQPDSLGELIFEFDVAGEGIDPKTMRAELVGEITSVEFRKHKYRELSLQANAENGVIDLHSEISDSLVQFSLGACADLLAETPYYQAQLNLDGIDLYGMGFSDKDLRVAGELQAQASVDSSLNIDSELITHQVLIIKEGDRYPVDSLVVRLNATPDSTGLSVRSGPIAGKFESNMALSEIPKMVQQHINHYYQLVDSANYLHPSDRFFAFDFNLRPTPALTEVLVPQLTNFSPGTLAGKFEEQSDVFDLGLVLPSVTYGEIRVDSLDLQVESAVDSLRYRLAINQTDIQDFRIDKTTVMGALANQQLAAKIEIRDSLNAPNLRLYGDFEQSDGSYQFRLRPVGFMMEGKRWTVSETNYFAFGDQGVKAHDMTLRNGAQSITLVSQPEELNAPLKLHFDGFLLRNIASVVQQDTSLLRGTVNGNIEWTFPDSAAQFASDITISEVAVMGTDMGNLSLQANYTPAQLEVDAKLKGNQNDIVVGGFYRFSPEDSLNLTANIKQLNTSIAAPFTTSFLDSLSGTLNGRVDVFGSSNNPQFTGDLNFVDVRFNVPFTGTRYLLKNESIRVENSGISFGQFAIRDSAQNRAIIAGKIRTPGAGYDDLRFDLDLSTERFRLVNSADDKETIFFGEVMLTSNFSVRGTADRPIIEGSATIDEGSDLSVVMPQSEAHIQNFGGIDRFVDRYPKGVNIMTRTVSADSTRTTLRGVNLHANLNIDRSTKLKLFIDDQRDNFVLARGDASLIFGIDPSGKITLTGRYEIAEGEYQLVYKTVVRRSFDIRSGSHITWVGDPLQAKLDITARYNVDTDALGLIQDQIATTNQSELNKYRQELPFWLLLNLRGDLSEPVIDFDIELPPESQGAFNGQVQAKLKQLNHESSESELNKQVFALLILGRFVPSDPTAGGGGMSATARNSVSRLLNTQLEKFSDKYIKGIDLNLSLDSYEDYSTGQAQGRTELNLGVGKSFMDDRLKINVGGSIDLEGEYRKKQKASDLIGDISAEYKLTKDGIWRLRGFRKNAYEGIIDGELVETGAALIFTRSYNELHEIFRSPEEKDSSKNEPKNTDE